MVMGCDGPEVSDTQPLIYSSVVRHVGVCICSVESKAQDLIVTSDGSRSQASFR